MWELDHKESWALKNRCFWTVVLEKALETPLDCKEIKPVNPRGNQSWIFIGRTNAEAETPILWPPDAKNWLIWKDPDAGKDWRQEEKGMTEDEIVGWHHLLNGYEFEQEPRVGDGQGSLTCCLPWGHKESGTTECLIELGYLCQKPRTEIGILFTYSFMAWFCVCVCVRVCVCVQLLSHVWLFVTPCTATCQISLSFTVSQSLLRSMSLKSVMPSNHFILCCPFPFCFQSFPASGFSWVGSLHQF